MANRKLNSIKFPDIADTYILDAGKVEYHETDTFEEDTVGKALQNKANIDGSYESMTVGNAEQLVSNVRVNDKTPYLFRTSGGSVDIGDREYVGGIVGGTVAWNQLVQNGNFTDLSDWYVYSGTGTVSNNELTVANAVGRDGVKRQQDSLHLINGHKYLYSVEYKSEYDLEMHFVVRSNILSATNVWARFAKVNAYTGEGLADAIDTFPKTNGQTCTFSLRNVMCIDLTQMFGSTIADYIYSLETANAGAGVAWFRKLFDKPYYAYNAGELKSVSGLVSHDMTGFNQASNVTYASGGTNYFQAVKGDFRLIAGQTYCVSVDTPNSGAKVYCPLYQWSTSGYSEKTCDGTRIQWVFNIKEDVVRTNEPIIQHVGDSSGTATGLLSNLCLNLSWDGSRNGEYEPYELHSYPLDSDLTLRGIPKLDANNNLYYDGDEYAPSGEVTRKYGIVDLGTLTWSVRNPSSESEYRRFNATVSGMKAHSSLADTALGIICSKYVASSAVIASVTVDKSMARYSGGIYITDSSYSDVTAFKTAMSGVYLVYELATPTTETADPYQQTQIVSDFGTEEFVIDDDVFAIPVGTDTEYPIDLRAKLEMAPNSPSDGDGDYILRQTNGMNEYVPLVIEDALPQIPSTAGSYKLTVTVADGVEPILSWEAE